MPNIFRFKIFKKLKRKTKINNWIFKVLNTEDFHNSIEFNTWGLCSKGTYSELFMKKVRIGDKLWFINKKNKILLRGKKVVRVKYAITRTAIKNILKFNANT